MAAAVADHGGGEASLRGMVMSLGGEIATPREGDKVMARRQRLSQKACYGSLVASINSGTKLRSRVCSARGK